MPHRTDTPRSSLSQAVAGICSVAALAVSCKGTVEESTKATAPTSSADHGAQAELERLDARTPLPLLPMMATHQKQNMRDHLVSVQEIVRATSRGDFAQVAKSAARIGSSEQMAHMCTHMGAGAQGFTEQALAFHRTADTITVAARASDADGVLQALDATLQGCTGCHSAFRQQVVDEATWARLTAHRSGTPH